MFLSNMLRILSGSSQVDKKVKVQLVKPMAMMVVEVHMDMDLTIIQLQRFLLWWAEHYSRWESRNVILISHSKIKKEVTSVIVIDPGKRMPYYSLLIL